MGKTTSGTKPCRSKSAVGSKIEAAVRRSTLRGVCRVEQQHAGRVGSHLAGPRRLAVAVVDFEPAVIDAHRRRARADAAGLPLAAAAVQALVPAPVDQVGRPRDPHLGAAERRRRVGSMKRDVLAIDSLREQDHVLVFRTENDPVAIEVAEIGRRGQRGRRAMARDRDISEEKPAVDRRDPRVFDSKFFQARVGQEPDVGDFC